MKYDALIIGGGPGGYECALGISHLGGKALVFERGELGGVCTNSGCIPTKALAASCEAYEKMLKAREYGFDAGDVKVDAPAVFSRRDRVSAIMRKGVEKLLGDAGVTVIRGEAKIKSKNTVQAGDELYSGKNLVIATGSEPTGAGQLKLDHGFVMSGDDAARSNDLPKSVVIVGGGFIGCEYASIYSTLGSKVTLVEALDRILPMEDADVSAEVARIMSKSVDIIVGARVDSIDSKMRTVTCGGRQIHTERVLLAVGRRPVYPEGTEGLGLKRTNGGLTVNGRMETSAPGVYAVGDVADGYKLAHTAYAGAEVAAKNIMGVESTVDYSAVPWCVFTYPEVGRVGLTGSAAGDALVGVASYMGNGKARCMGERSGFCKVLADRKTHRILGCHFVGSHSSDLLGEACLAVNCKLTLDDVVKTIHAHPTLSEVFKSACNAALKAA